MMNISEWEIAARLLLSSLLASLIGIERERHGRPAGLRTHILVSLGSCLVMLTSIYGFMDSTSHDPGRLPAQVVSGIGFLGAGTILREGVTVKGLTTAASLWVVAGIGLAIGSGFYFPGLLVTALSVLTLLFLEPVEKKLFSQAVYGIKLTMDGSFEQNALLTEVTSLPGLLIKRMEYAVEPEKNQAVLDIIINAREMRKEQIIAHFMRIRGVKKVIIK